MVTIDDSYLAHYGVMRRSGRYPWGSGGNLDLETAKSFLDYVEYLKHKLGLSEAEVAKDLGVSTTQLRAKKSIAKSEEKQANIIMAQRLKDKGYSNLAIGERMGAPESTVRTWLAPGAEDKAQLLDSTTAVLKEQVAEKKYIQIGTGVERHMGISETKLKTAVALAQEEGYNVYYVKVKQLGTGKDTTVKVLAAPDVTYSEVYANQDKIQVPFGKSDDGGRTYPKLHDPIAVNPRRVAVRYAEEGGAEADGVIYVRPGAKDLTLGDASYAQVRVKVGQDHYLKGMAMYKDDLPEGVDLMFNTNKSDTGNKLDAMKPIKADAELPFGSIVSQVVKNPGKPNEKNISALNIVNEEGDWTQWSKTLSPQMLSKQSPTLARTQLDMTFERRKKEFDDIQALTNPTVRKKLLEEFADGTDAAAVHMKAAALPRQGSHVILPISSMKPNEVYAPNYLDGERVVLIRYPHGGTFEIPELTVNNRQREAKKLLGQARDAIGIHHSVAERLSGADFDGDTVLVIPNAQKKVKHVAPLQELKDFDPRSQYPGYPGMKKMTNTQTEMGKVSNLITDMTIRGAPHSEIARAVKHSMVVIDAEKHELNYKQSYIDNNIPALKAKYQTKLDGSSGASTLISRAKGRVYVPDQKPRPMAEGGPVDKKTGKKVFVETGATNYRTGKPLQNRKAALEVADDAFTLSSGTRIEGIYAEHSNKLKTMANQARLAAVNTPSSKYSPSAKKAYPSEVETLNAKLNVALRNRPLERQAQVVANAMVKARRAAEPDMDTATRKKIEGQELEKARARTGAKKQQIQITPKEWDAIQAGAISDSKLATILNNADMDIVKQLATPKPKLLMSNAMSTRATQMLASGATRAEVASQLGVSVTTLDRALNDG